MEQYLPYLSVVIAVLGLYFTSHNSKRTDVKEIEEKAIAQARIDTKLDNLTNINLEVRSQVSDLAKQQIDLNQRVSKVEESAKSAHKRIDELHIEENH